MEYGVPLPYLYGSSYDRLVQRQVEQGRSDSGSGSSTGSGTDSGKVVAVRPHARTPTLPL